MNDSSNNQEINNSKAAAERICSFTQDLLSIHESSEGSEHAPEHGVNYEIVNENDNDDVIIVELLLPEVSITSSSDANRSGNHSI
eukprot:12358948-Ditylum_brightwellii.AAC.1